MRMFALCHKICIWSYSSFLSCFFRNFFFIAMGLVWACLGGPYFIEAHGPVPAALSSWKRFGTARQEEMQVFLFLFLHVKCRTRLMATAMGDCSSAHQQSNNLSKKKKQSNNRSRLDGQRKERMRPRGGRGADVTLRGPSPLNPVFFLKQMPIPGS